MIPKNAVNFFFKHDNKNSKHQSSCNIQCLDAMVYNAFDNKTVKLYSKHVQFIPHPRSLDESNAPCASELTRLGCSNVNIAPASTI